MDRISLLLRSEAMPEGLIAGVLYPIIGLGGILPIDLATFAMAIATLVWI